MADRPKITIVLLNYERPQNIPIILEAIKNQTVKATVFLWNNGDADVNSALIDRYEKSDRNVGCMVRWKLAKEAETPYVMSMDDDICFRRNDALEDIIKSLEKQDHPNRIIGVCGASFGSIPFYTMGKNFEFRLGKKGDDHQAKPLTMDIAADIIKGRVMAFRRHLLDGIEFPEEREDDIFLSSAFANRARNFHRIPLALQDAFYDLPTYGRGNWLETHHFLSRDRALRTYFSPGGLLDKQFIRYAILSPYRLKLLVLKKLKRLK